MWILGLKGLRELNHGGGGGEGSVSRRSPDTSTFWLNSFYAISRFRIRVFLCCN